MRVVELKNELVNRLMRNDKILAVAQTGSVDAPLVPGKSDIDMFVLCTQVPNREERKQMYDELKEATFRLEMEVCNGGIWGYGDILFVDEIDVMPMYFTVEEMESYLREVLDCKHLYKDGRFYPVGRVASISTISILQEKKETWSRLKAMVNEKPESFFQTWYQFEADQILDEEDLGRSELRGEVLFYHQVLENAMDHYLQALYAINRIYFPSRKRTLSDLDSFAKKPEHCGERLLEAVRLGAESATIQQSIVLLRQLTEELRALA